MDLLSNTNPRNPAGFAHARFRRSAASHPALRDAKGSLAQVSAPHLSCILASCVHGGVLRPARRLAAQGKAARARSPRLPAQAAGAPQHDGQTQHPLESSIQLNPTKRTLTMNTPLSPPRERGDTSRIVHLCRSTAVSMGSATLSAAWARRESRALREKRNAATGHPCPRRGDVRRNAPRSPDPGHPPDVRCGSSSLQ